MSGTVRTGSYGTDNYRVAVDWSISSQSVANNSTTLYYRIYADNTGYSTTWIQYHNTRVTINGTTVYSQGSPINGYKNQTFKTGTIVIPHNSDGTKTVSITVSTNMYYPTQNGRSGSDNITLTRIDRGISNFRLATGWTDLDGIKTITFDKYNPNTTVEIRWQFWLLGEGKRTNEYILRDTANRSLENDYESGTQFRFQENLITAMHEDKKGSTFGTVYITARVRQGGSVIQTITRQTDLNLRVEAPTVRVSTRFIGRGQSLLGRDDRGLRSAHKLEVTINSTAKNGAVIDRHNVFYDGRTTTTTDNVVVLDANIAGTRELAVRSYDSRGFNFRVTVDVTVLDYTPPRLTHRAYRVDGGVENPIGTTGRIEGNIAIDTVRDNGNRSVNQPYWLIDLSGRSNSTSSITYSTYVDIGNSQNYKITYGDSFTRATVNGTIPVGKAPFIIGEQSVGINMVPPDDTGGLFISGRWNSDRSINLEIPGTDGWIIRTATGYPSYSPDGVLIGKKNGTGWLFLQNQIRLVDTNSGGTQKIIINEA